MAVIVIAALAVIMMVMMRVFHRAVRVFMAVAVIAVRAMHVAVIAMGVIMRMVMAVVVTMIAVWAVHMRCVRGAEHEAVPPGGALRQRGGALQHFFNTVHIIGHGHRCGMASGENQDL